VSYKIGIDGRRERGGCFWDDLEVINSAYGDQQDPGLLVTRSVSRAYERSPVVYNVSREK
jgi:hypothetical protein